MRPEAGVETGDREHPAPSVRLHVHRRANLQMQLVERRLPVAESQAPPGRLRALLALLRRGCRAVLRD